MRVCVYSFLGIRLQGYLNSDLLQISVIIYEFGHGVLKSDVFVGLYRHYLGDVLGVQSFKKRITQYLTLSDARVCCLASTWT